jgi:hypothetical protein
LARGLSCFCWHGGRVMGKHTRGPWHVRDFDGSIGSIDAAGDMPVAQAMQTRPIRIEPNQDERRANARLIAAAPDLLEACKVASALLKGLPRSLGYDFDARQLDAAIAKATGEQP